MIHFPRVLLSSHLLQVCCYNVLQCSLWNSVNAFFAPPPKRNQVKKGENRKSSYFNCCLATNTRWSIGQQHRHSGGDQETESLWPARKMEWICQSFRAFYSTSNTKERKISQGKESEKRELKKNIMEPKVLFFFLWTKMTFVASKDLKNVNWQ